MARAVRFVNDLTEDMGGKGFRFPHLGGPGGEGVKGCEGNPWGNPWPCPWCGCEGAEVDDEGCGGAEVEDDGGRSRVWFLI